MGVTNNTIAISPKQVITIYNILRAIGLNTSLRGTKYLNKAIQIMIITKNDLAIIEDIYRSIAYSYNNITPKQVKNDITYAINSRVTEKSLKNFESIFGFEYDEYIFTNRSIIEEIARIMKVEFIN